MRSRSFGYCLLPSLLLTFIIGSQSFSPVVKVKLNESATLHCSERCSGLVTWTVSHKSHDILAQCNQTMCQWTEGFQMSHHQYLEGDPSLTITEADYSKRSWYTCTCNSKDISDVQLQIEPGNTPVHLTAGESLELDLLISEPVKVCYNGTGAAGPFGGQICTVDGDSLECKDEYAQRVSLTSVLELRGTTPSDSGVYTIMTQRNEELIHTYTVTVQDDQWTSVPVWVIVLSAVLAGALVILVLTVITLRQRNKVLEVSKRKDQMNEQDTHISGVSTVPVDPLKGHYQAIPSNSSSQN